MRIHTDVLTRADFSTAFRAAGLGADGVHIDECGEYGSRKRARAFELKLTAEPREGRRRQRNTGQYGPEFAFCEPLWVAATWDEWGRMIAELYEIDPAAIVGPYDDRDNFHRQTDDRYRMEIA